jgi:hypothetical protein
LNRWWRGLRSCPSDPIGDDCAGPTRGLIIAGHTDVFVGRGYADRWCAVRRRAPAGRYTVEIACGAGMVGRRGPNPGAPAGLGRRVCQPAGGAGAPQRRASTDPHPVAIHSGGMVICDRPIADVCPVEWARMENRSVLQWDKDDCAAIGLVKFDLLGLGLLSALHYVIDLVAEHKASRWTWPS